MYFIECNNCGHHNHLKTEYQTFCEDCGKKLTNNFQAWQKLHPGRNFTDFKKEVCIQKDPPPPQLNVQEPTKPKRKRNLIFLAVTMAVFGVIGGFFGRKIASVVMDYVRPYTTANYNAVEAGDWRLIRSDDGLFEISFPGAPTKNKQSSATPTGEIDITSYAFAPKIGADDNLSYVIAYSDYPQYTVDSRYMTGIEIENVLDQSVLGSAKNVEGKLLSSKKIKLGNFTGKEFEVSVQNDMALIIGRTYLVNNTVYSLNVIEPSNNKSNASSLLFLDSFRLLE